MTNRIPSDDEIAMAVMWLRCNEGDKGEAEACAAVADWIERDQHDRYLRNAARRARVPIARLRHEVAKRAYTTPPKD